MIAKEAGKYAFKAFGLTVLRGVATSGAGSIVGQIMRADLYNQPINWGDFGRNLGISMLSGGVGSAVGYPIEVLTQKLSPAANAFFTSTADGISAYGINLGTQSLEMLIDGNFDPDNLDYQAAINDAVISAGSAFAGTMANRASAKQQPTENTALGQEQGRVVVDDGDAPVPKPPDTDSNTEGSRYQFFNDEKVPWTATRPKGTQQTYQITQRTDIDWNQVRTQGDKRFIGKTNAEAAAMGLPPQLPDGNFATLHHLGQDSRGPLVEASTRYHGVGKPGQDTLHGQYGKNMPNPNYPINRGEFSVDTREYWKWRVQNP